MAVESQRLREGYPKTGLFTFRRPYNICHCLFEIALITVRRPLQNIFLSSLALTSLHSSG